MKFSLFLFVVLLISNVAQADLISRLESLEGKKSYLPGPNCWNSVLYSYEMVANLRHTVPGELNFWLNSAYCRKIVIPDELKSGDIVALRSRTDGELHAMLWMDEENVFSKNTSHRLDPYEFQKSELIYSSFRVTEAECKAHDQNHPESCIRIADYYRCRSPEEDRNLLKQKDPAYAELANEITQLTKDIETLAFRSDLEVSEVRIHNKNFKARWVRIETKYQNQNNNIHFFWKALGHELKSVQEQIRVMDVWVSKTASRTRPAVAPSIRTLAN